MAQEKEGCSNKNSPNNNSDSEDAASSNGNNSVKPDLGFENTNYTTNSLDKPASGSSDKNNASKVTGQGRKEESPFSFKHFLKRDLSLPSASASYEGTGARPKIYPSVRPDLDLHPEQPKESRKKENRDNLLAELMLNYEPGSNLIADAAETSHRRTAQLPDDSSGVPSLPDFVQDHLLVEQAYLGRNTPLTIDLDNLPDFTLNSNYNEDSQPKVRNFYDNRSEGGSVREVHESPLDLPGLSLDLTESVGRSDRRDSRRRLPFPLDLPNASSTNAAGGESFRLPDFLPAQAGTSTRDDLLEERRLRNTAERELRAALQTMSLLRREASEARQGEQAARRELAEARAASSRLARDLRGVGRVSSMSTSSSTVSSAASTSGNLSAASQSVFVEGDEKRSGSDENNVAKLKSQISQLKEDLLLAHADLDEMREGRKGAARALVLATNTADASLRELLSGLDRLRGLASTLDPP